MTSKKVKVESHGDGKAEQMEAKSDSGDDSSDDENPDIYKGDEVQVLVYKILIFNVSEFYFCVFLGNHSRF